MSIVNTAIGLDYDLINQILTEQNPRSPKWPELSKQIIKKHPICSACNVNMNLEVHHIKPFHLYPELELIEDNCMVFCRLHHFIIGHFCDWGGWNVKAVRDAVRYKSSLHRNKKNMRI